MHTEMVSQKGDKLLTISVQTDAYSGTLKCNVNSIGCDLTVNQRNKKSDGR
jgi:hypothetical protein